MNNTKKHDRGKPLIDTTKASKKRDYLTLKEACSYAKVSQGTLRKYKQELSELGSVCSPKGYKIKKEHLHQLGIIKPVKSEPENNLTLEKLNELKQEIAELKQERSELKNENKTLRDTLQDAQNLQQNQAKMIFDYQQQMKEIEAPQNQTEPTESESENDENSENKNRRSLWDRLFGV